ncbi:transposase [Frigoriglobus tundricola]|uniref:transposase n=1 Tax=Frigoriglobus tundricola TaxID=2774151 RepID=UPI00148EE112|nr:transposase [Frigoriglobus tundricola]
MARPRSSVLAVPAQVAGGEGDRGIRRWNQPQGAGAAGFLARNRRLWLERLPPYTPELNPVEQVWSRLKYGQWANVVPDDLSALDDEVID